MTAVIYVQLFVDRTCLRFVKTDICCNGRSPRQKSGGLMLLADTGIAISFNLVPFVKPQDQRQP